MAVKANIKLIQEALDAFNAHDLDSFVGIYAESALHYQPNKSEPLMGRSEIREDYFKSTFVAFPDVRFEKTNAFGQGHWVCVEGILKGTHKGPLIDPNNKTIAATNKSIKVPICFVIKMREHKVVEVHEYNDQLGFFSQIGLTPK